MGGQLRVPTGTVGMDMMVEVQAGEDKSLGCQSLLAFSRVCACCRFPSGSHVFSAAEYPFQDTRYYLHPCVLQCERILSILYSFSPPIRSGGGLEKFGPCSGVSL